MVQGNESALSANALFRCLKHVSEVCVHDWAVTVNLFTMGGIQQYGPKYTDHASLLDKHQG